MKKGMIRPVVICLLFFVLSSCYTYENTQQARIVSAPAQSVTVEAFDDEISYNLDLRAVASVFADSRNLEDFERMLNEYDRGISNLDLNHDGYVDYLRVVEVYENGTHLILLQAALDYDVFQDVASIIVESRGEDNISVQIVGDPYIYGTAYIIDPIYYRTPVIYSSFRSPGYMIWSSPYYWGYYPAYYHYRNPIYTNTYMNSVYINANNNYRYDKAVRNQRTVSSMQKNVSRNDYARTNPGQSFSSRNTNVKNAREIQSSNNRNTQTTTNSTRNSSSSTRNSGNTTNSSSSTRSSSSGTNSNINNSPSTRSSSSGTNSNTNNSPSTRSSSSGTNTNNSSSRRGDSNSSVNSNTNNSSSTRSSSSGTNSNNSSSTRSSSSSSSGRR